MNYHVCMGLDYKVIGERIKEARESAGLSQQELGEKVGLSTTAISLFESAERKMTLDILVSVASALNVTLNELIEGYKEPPINISFRASREAMKDPKFKEALGKAVKEVNDELRGK